MEAHMVQEDNLPSLRERRAVLERARLVLAQARALAERLEGTEGLSPCAAPTLRSGRIIACGTRMGSAWAGRTTA